MHSLSDTIHIAILGAVLPEVKGFSHLLREAHVETFIGETFWRGSYQNRHILVGTTGFGKVNAAVTTAALLERFSIQQVWHIGCAGAYIEGGLERGDVLVSQVILCGDEGILTAEKVLSTAEIGIPILIRGEEKYYDRIPVEDSIIRKIQDKTPAGCYRLPSTPKSSTISTSKLPSEENDAESFRLAFGPSLTVSLISGDGETARDRFRQFGALAENMEGSAVAQTCFRFGVPMLECRGISNMAGDRCKARWQLGTAMAHCHGIVTAWLDDREGSVRANR